MNISDQDYEAVSDKQERSRDPRPFPDPPLRAAHCVRFTAYPETFLPKQVWDGRNKAIEGRRTSASSRPVEVTSSFWTNPGTPAAHANR